MMKKNPVAFLVLISLFSTLLILQLPVFANFEDTVLLVQEDFTAEDNTWLKDYAGGTGFVDGWKLSIDAELNPTELPEDWKILDNQLTAAGTTGWGKSLGQNANITRQLQNTIDFSQDGEYYISYKTKVTSVGTGCTHNLSLDTDTRSEYTFGYAYSGGIYSYIGGNTPFGNKTSTRALTNNTWYTFVIHVSTRATGNDIARIKAFADGETPTFTPDFWDLEYRNNKAYVINRIRLVATNGTGSAERPYFDEIAIYKGSMVKVSQTNDKADLIEGQVLNVTVPAINSVTGHAQTFTNEWYDCTDEIPVLLSTDTSYTVPASMVGRLLRAIVTITDTESSTTTTYYPMSKYVRAGADVNKILFNTGSQQVTATIQIYKSGTEHGTQGSVQPILAKYNAHGNLLAVKVGDSKSYNSVWQGETTNATVQLTPCIIEEGEYVKVFVWDSIDGLKPMSVNKNSYETVSQTPVN